jgi:hypothetical protein
MSRACNTNIEDEYIQYIGGKARMEETIHVSETLLLMHTLNTILR